LSRRITEDYLPGAVRGAGIGYGRARDSFLH